MNLSRCALGPAKVSFWVKHYELPLASGNRWDDADFIAVFERGGIILQETDILFVDIDVHEAANLAFIVHQAFGNAGKPRLQLLDGRANGGSVDFNQLLVVGQLAERRWNADFLCHKL